MKSALISMLLSSRKLLPGLLGLACLCNAGTVLAQARYSFSTDGSEVTDTKTGLVWRRCSQGQTWSEGTATCTGAAATYTYQAARTFAETQTGWRLPNEKELSSLVDSSRSNPAVDITAFPATVSGWYWSLSPNAGDAAKPWGVGFSSGYAGQYDSRYYEAARLRLVR